MDTYINIWQGGREAGYNNTCGSDIGWAPKTFISSRTKRGNFLVLITFSNDIILIY